MQKKYTWKIGGEAGFGIKSVGLMFSKICTRAGLEVFDNSDYPSLIRGGHNTYQVTVSDQPVYGIEHQVDLLIALNQETIDTHWAELNHGSAIIYDATVVKIPKSKLADRNVSYYHVPWTEIYKKIDALPLMRNTISLGATVALMKLSWKDLESMIRQVFAHKEKLIPINIQAARQGYDYIRDQYKEEEYKIDLSHLEKRNKQDKRLVISGNEAIGLGALAAGCNFYAAYPMTPSSSLLHYLAEVAPQAGMIVRHAEDEISVINMALGASHAGARAMCGTAGGGFSLMVEALGLAGITETPLVILEAQRPGPATGLPTWTGQGDLHFVMHAAQDDFERIILAPGDTEECFRQTVLAFNLADQYQMPVIILSDKYLAESYRSTQVFDSKKVKINRGKILTAASLRRQKDFRRYRLTADGVSPRTLPGTLGGIFLANSDEHDQYGLANEDSQNRIEQVDKRARKLATAARELDTVSVYGNPRARKTIIGWGSTKGPVLDAMRTMRKPDEFNFVHFNIIWPFPHEAFKRATARSKSFYLMEGNSTGQLGKLIRQETGVVMDHRFLKYDGRPLFPEEIRERLNHW